MRQMAFSTETIYIADRKHDVKVKGPEAGGRRIRSRLKHF